MTVRPKVGNWEKHQGGNTGKNQRKWEKILMKHEEKYVEMRKHVGDCH